MFIEIGYLLTDYLGFGYTISTYQLLINPCLSRIFLKLLVDFFSYVILNVNLVRGVVVVINKYVEKDLLIAKYMLNIESKHIPWCINNKEYGAVYPWSNERIECYFNYLNQEDKNSIKDKNFE